jgi:hypothetical protein
MIMITVGSRRAPDFDLGYIISASGENYSANLENEAFVGGTGASVDQLPDWQERDQCARSLRKRS